MSKDKDKRDLILSVLYKWNQRQPKPAFLSFPIAALETVGSLNFAIQVFKFMGKVVDEDTQANEQSKQNNSGNDAYEYPQISIGVICFGHCYLLFLWWRGWVYYGLFGIIDTENGTNDKADNTAYNNSY